MRCNELTILYDELGFMEPHGGVSRYYTELVKHLPAGIVGRFSAVCSNNAYLQGVPFNLPPMKHCVMDFIKRDLRGHQFPGVSHIYRILARMYPQRFPSGELANRRAFAHEVKVGDFDIFHLTDPHPRFNSWRNILGKKPIIATIVDLIPEVIYHDKRVRYYRRKLLMDAKHIIAITENTKKDIMRLYDIPEKKISVVYLGYNMNTELDSEVVDIGNRWGLENNRFVLFVGKRAGYKNFNWMVRALAPILRKGLKLFCTGVPFSESENKLLLELGVKGNVIQDFVSDAEMKALFANALAFIYPSLYEGFGIPILDAFAAGCPAVLANASCFPEVAGDAALYFDPANAEDLQRKLLRLMNSKEERQELVCKELQHVKQFSWEKCANETAKIYNIVRGFGDK